MELHEKRRGIYVATAIVLLGGGFLLRNAAWQGSASLHTLMELAATLLASFVGAMALVRFFSRRDAQFLYIGAGFLGTAMLDGYHAVVTSIYFQPYMPSDNPHLVPWSWIASRLFLSVLLFTSWLLWFKHRNDVSFRPNARIVMIGTAVATIASFLFFATVPLPTISIEGAIVSRPAELLPAIFFLMALVGYLYKGAWRDDQFEHWLVLSLIVGVATQTIFMPFSEHLYDAEFNLAHLLKKLSYILVLIGLLTSLYRTYKDFQAEEKALLKASAYARSLIEASLDPLVTINPEGKITDVNHATEAVTGRSRAELIATDFSDYFTAPDKAREGYQQVFAKGFVTDYPLALRHRDGHVTDVLYNASVYRNEAGEVLGVFAAARDITERKLSEATRTQLAAIVESSNDAIIGKTPDGIITSWNKSAERIYGYSADEIIGKHVTALAPPARHTEMQELLEKVCNGGLVNNHESERVRKDGALIDVALTLSPIRDASGKVTGISTIARDITERKKAEFVLRQSEEALKEAQRIAHLGSWYMDLATNQVVWSEVLYKIYGLEPALSPPLYTESMKLFTPESWEKLSSAIAQTTQTGIPYELELESVRKDGGRRWMWARGELVRDTHGTPVRVRGVVMDITGRKQAEVQLRRSEHGLAEAQRIAHLGNWELDLVHNVLTWSDEIYRIFEIDPKKFGASYEAFLGAIHPDDRDMVNNSYTESLKSKKPYDIVHRLLMQDGRVKYVNEKCETYYAEDGKPLRSVGTVHDISELKQAEDEIKALNRDLEQRVVARTEQLAAANKELEAFAYSVSHDLRSPLRAIDGFSHILLEDYACKLDDEGKRLLNVVCDNTIRMGQLIDDILKFSRTGRLELTFSEIDMEKLAREVIAELQPAGGKLQVEIEPIPPARGDNAMMHQVFVNLLSNAIKFSSSRENATVKVGGSIAGNESVYFVRDNGVGFDMQYADKLFGVFQRLHGVSEFEGTGIGLAIVKRIVTRHGGRVWAEGKVNEGATIYFALPV